MTVDMSVAANKSPRHPGARPRHPLVILAQARIQSTAPAQPRAGRLNDFLSGVPILIGTESKDRAHFTRTRA